MRKGDGSDMGTLVKRASVNARYLEGGIMVCDGFGNDNFSECLLLILQFSQLNGKGRKGIVCDVVVETAYLEVVGMEGGCCSEGEEKEERESFHIGWKFCKSSELGTMGGNLLKANLY